MLVLGFISHPSRKTVTVFSGWWVFVPPAPFLFCLPSSSTVRDAHFEWDSLILNNFIGLKYNLIVSFFVTCPFLPSQISFSDRFANDSHCSIFSPYCWIILFISLLLEHLGERLEKPFWKKKVPNSPFQATEERSLREAERCMQALRLGGVHLPCDRHGY